MTKFVCGFALLAMSMANAAESYRVTLFQPSVIGGKEVKAGEYKISVENNKATMKVGKEVVEAPVKLETVDNKYGSTSVRYRTGEGKNTVEEIRMGNTKTKLVFQNRDQSGL
ncbi:MAG: hypothetical protein HYZ37_04140 [Candidatus Solibacter usitatus]|nr:hypothetical protein [Candidatus Solibacter usitatus]